MSKFFQLKPHGTELVVLLLVIAAFFGIREIYGDIFSGDGYWKAVGFALCFGALLVTLAVALAMIGKHGAFSTGSLLSLAGAVFLIWYVFDAASPETQFQRKRQAYLANIDAENAGFGGRFMAWDIKEDFLSDRAVSQRLFKDTELISELLRDLQPRARWHSLAFKRDYKAYFEEALICYASLRSSGHSDAQIFQKPHGEHLFGALIFMHLQLRNGAGIQPVDARLNKHLSHFQQEFQPIFRQFVEGELRTIPQHNLYEMEMLLYFLTQVPTKISDAQFAELMARWKELKPTYQQTIDQLMTARSYLKDAFERAQQNEVLGVSLTDGRNSQNYLFGDVQPFLTLTGIATELGEELELVYTTELEKLAEKKNLVYETVEKKRRVRKQTYDIDYELGPLEDGYRTERYKEQKVVGSETVEVIMQTVSLALGDQVLISDLPTHLPKQFFDKAQKDYAIEPGQMNRGESWIFALPQEWF